MISSFVRIILPDRVDNLIDYCKEKFSKVYSCFGYWKPNCPKTCSYAKEMDKMERLGIGTMTKEDVRRLEGKVND